MVFVCKQHVNNALKMIFLPHIQPISEDYKFHGDVKCQICGQQGDYKLYNFATQGKQLINRAM